jgi:hypothetical protein
MTHLSKEALPHKNLLQVFNFKRGEQHELAASLRDVAERMIETPAKSSTGALVLIPGQQQSYSSLIKIAHALEVGSDMSTIFGESASTIIQGAQQTAGVLKNINPDFVTEKESKKIALITQVLGHDYSS